MKISTQLLGKNDNNNILLTQQNKAVASMFNDAYNDTVKIHSRNDNQHYILNSSNSYSISLDHTKKNLLFNDEGSKLNNNLPL